MFDTWVSDRHSVSRWCVHAQGEHRLRSVPTEHDRDPLFAAYRDLQRFRFVLICGKMLRGVVERARLEDIAEGQREEFLEFQSCAGPRVKAVVRFGELAEQCAIETGFAAEADRMQINAAEAGTNRSDQRRRVLQSIGEQQDGIGAHARRHQLIARDLQSATDAGHTARNQAANNSCGKRRWPD